MGGETGKSFLKERKILRSRLPQCAQPRVWGFGTVPISKGGGLASLRSGGYEAKAGKAAGDDAPGPRSARHVRGAVVRITCSVWSALSIENKLCSY